MPSCTCSSVLDAEGQTEDTKHDLEYTPEPQPNEDSVPNLTEAITLMTKELTMNQPPICLELMPKNLTLSMALTPKAQQLHPLVQPLLPKQLHSL